MEEGERMGGKEEGREGRKEGKKGSSFTTFQQCEVTEAAGLLLTPPFWPQLIGLGWKLIQMASHSAPFPGVFEFQSKQNWSF